MTIKIFFNVASQGKETMIDCLLNMYMLSSNPNNDHVLHVEQLLKGCVKFKHLFVEKVDNQIVVAILIPIELLTVCSSFLNIFTA